MDVDTNESSTSNLGRSPITKVRYDFSTRPLDTETNKDPPEWELCNPVDPVTGLWYDGRISPSQRLAAQASTNSNAVANIRQSNNANSQAQGADWYDLLQTYLRHGYDTSLQTSLEDHPLLLVEKSYNPPPIRQQALECLFEELQVPAAFLAKDAVMSCYGCGRTTSMVIDVGYASGTTVTPVYDGYVEQVGIQRSPIGLAQMDQLLLQQMDALYKQKTKNKNKKQVLPLYYVKYGNKKLRRPDLHQLMRMQLALDCRESGAGAAINTTTVGTGGGPPDAAAAAGAATTFHAPNKPFELPDGTILDIPSTTRFGVADLLFGTDATSTQRRQDRLQTLKEELSTLIADATTEDKDSKEGGTENNPSKGNDEANKEPAYSEAEAVGISKRRTKRGAGASKQSTTVKVPFSNRRLQKACSSYLQTQLDFLTASPVASMVCDSAYRCDRDQQVALLGNVIVGGGGACLGPTEQAVPDLIRDQVESILHTHTPGWRVKVLSPGMQERSILSWLGGSILASMGTFHDMWITKAEYEEWGSAIVNRKCP